MGQFTVPSPRPYTHSPFAAVIISLEILENSAPRRRSALPLSCLILDHRECPEEVVEVVENGAIAWGRSIRILAWENWEGIRFAVYRSIEMQLVFTVGGGIAQVIVGL